MKQTVRILVIVLVMVLQGGMLRASAAQTVGDRWLVYAESNERYGTATLLWAVRPDGTEKQQLAEGKSIVSLAASPKGGYVAYVSSTFEKGKPIRDITLTILRLPTEQPIFTLPLTSPETEQKPEDVGAMTSDVLAAVLANDSLAWSPDGTMLAFVGAHEGNSADVYVYSTKAGKVTRLTDGPTQAARLVWSPDSRSIVHLGVKSFGTGGGRDIPDAWAVRADGTAIKRLYKPEGAGEDILGWLDNQTYLAFKARIDCGDVDIFTFNIETSQKRVLISGCFDKPVYDASTKTIYFSVYEGSGLATPPAAGLYAMTLSGEATLLLPETKNGGLYLAASGVVLMAQNVNQYAVLSDDQKSLRPLPLPGVPLPDATNEYWAWRDLQRGGLTITGPNGENPRTLAKPGEFVTLVAWSS
jgi:dipeptidyl aminopeptidase/acylaminoacyl peptidase